ncbi:MAG: DNA-binding response regulator [Nitrospiraceae bacterium]|nr:MAG: DNA-binding response regulator [Nitrospiraceae bacterium]
MYRVLIVDDHPVVRMGLREILEKSRIVQSVDEACSGREALAKVREESYELVVLDISMPGMSGLETLCELKKLTPSLPVLMLTVHQQEDYALKSLRAGASGYLTKISAPEELLTAVVKILRGQRYIGPALADVLVSHLADPEDVFLYESLSDREWQVLLLLVEGETLEGISKELSVSPKTVSTFRTRILHKLRLKNNAELIHYVMRSQMLD